MNSVTFRRTALVATALLLLLGSNAAFADPKGTATSQPLSFTVGSPQAPIGTVLDLGDQKYVVSGGQVVTAMIGGVPLDPGATLRFSLNAEVEGIMATGSANFKLQGTQEGQQVSVSGTFPINPLLTMTLASVMPGPSGTCSGKAVKSCSELPTFFVGTAVVQTKVGDPTNVSKTTMELENPYLNPFGAPIVLTSADGSIFIVTTYDVGTIHWRGSQVQGPITGTLGTSTQVTGMLSLNSSETEDLVAGTAVDHGTIAFDSMTPAMLNTQGPPGKYNGTSSIPTPNPLFDCTSAIGFPFLSSAGISVCVQTGFNSSGQYSVKSNGAEQVTIAGQYITTWTTPALAFWTASTATVTP